MPLRLPRFALSRLGYRTLLLRLGMPRLWLCSWRGLLLLLRSFFFFTAVVFTLLMLAVSAPYTAHKRTPQCEVTSWHQIASHRQQRTDAAPDPPPCRCRSRLADGPPPRTASACAARECSCGSPWRCIPPSLALPQWRVAAGGLLLFPFRRARACFSCQRWRQNVQGQCLSPSTRATALAQGVTSPSSRRHPLQEHDAIQREDPLSCDLATAFSSDLSFHFFMHIFRQLPPKLRADTPTLFYQSTSKCCADARA